MRIMPIMNSGRLCEKIGEGGREKKFCRSPLRYGH